MLMLQVSYLRGPMEDFQKDLGEVLDNWIIKDALQTDLLEHEADGWKCVSMDFDNHGQGLHVNMNCERAVELVADQDVKNRLRRNLNV